MQTGSILQSFEPVKKMEDKMTEYKLPVEQAMIQVARNYGIDEILPNETQLFNWTVNRVASGDKIILAQVQELSKELK